MTNQSEHFASVISYICFGRGGGGGGQVITVLSLALQSLGRGAGT